MKACVKEIDEQTFIDTFKGIKDHRGDWRFPDGSCYNQEMVELQNTVIEVTTETYLEGTLYDFSQQGDETWSWKKEWLIFPGIKCEINRLLSLYPIENILVEVLRRAHEEKI